VHRERLGISWIYSAPSSLIFKFLVFVPGPVVFKTCLIGPGVSTMIIMILFFVSTNQYPEFLHNGINVDHKEARIVKKQ